MNIVILTGSPRARSSSRLLAENFQRGAREAGHSLFHFDAAHKQVHGCIGCNSCHMDGPCVFNDDFSELRAPLLEADMVVFSYPMYYFGIPSQIKAVIDRFYSLDMRLKTKKAAALFLTCKNAMPELASGITATFEHMLAYLEWENRGVLWAGGVDEEGDLLKTDYPQKAYALGKRVQEESAACRDGVAPAPARRA